MKILIVDDEALTRNGIRAAIDWASLGIHRLELAGDGRAALDLVRRDPPDILLTDVRMPRMDGIALAEAYRKRRPDGSILFMSGYSDKPYLKSAIHLHAVTYLEKPISLEELRAALEEAAAAQRSRTQSDALAAQQRLLACRRLARAIQRPDLTPTELRTLLQQYRLDDMISPSHWVCALLVCGRPCASADLTHALTLKLVLQAKQFGITVLPGEGPQNTLLFFLLCPGQMDRQAVWALAEFLLGQLSPHGQTLVTLGPPEHGLDRACHSLQTAHDLMKYRFFCEDSQILSAPPETTSDFIPLWELQRAFAQAFSARDWESLDVLTQRIFQHFKHSPCFDPLVIQDFYYTLISMIHRTLSAADGASDELEQSKVSYWSAAVENESLSTFHNLLLEELRRAQGTGRTTAEHEAVRGIKEYIRAEFADPDLSIKQICEYMHRSSAYLCTLFKEETGETINQYLTAYRMDRAKELLASPRSRIADIASMVGYRDGNYFGKVFRASEGLSPSEYRERQAQ